MTLSLTLRQRAMLQWLREADYPALAECAETCWSRGHSCLLPVAIRDPILLTQYERANGGIVRA